MAPLPESMRWGMEGTRLSEAEAERLEDLVREHPGELRLRCLLLGKYFLNHHSFTKQQKDARQEHIQWVVSNHPESAIAGSPFAHWDDAVFDPSYYDQIKQLWLSLVASRPASAKVKGNAAHFFTIFERKLALDLFRAASQLEPTNPEWADWISRLADLPEIGLEHLRRRARRPFRDDEISGGGQD